MIAKSEIAIARVYEAHPPSHSARLLVDRVWPRGLSRQSLDLDDWIPDAAPTTRLRKWFAHDVGRWDAFQQRYRAELDARPNAVDRCLSWCRKGPVLLLFGARDRDHNQAVVLRDYLSDRLSR